MNDAEEFPKEELVTGEIVPAAATVDAIASFDAGAIYCPEMIAKERKKATRRFLEFFAAEIANDNTRKTYYRAVLHFFTWCEAQGVGDIDHIEPIVVAVYIKEEKARRGRHGVQTVKVELAAIRSLFDYLVTGHVLLFNPALSVRDPKHVIAKGKTPVISGAEAKRLLESIPIY